MVCLGDLKDVQHLLLPCFLVPAATQQNACRPCTDCHAEAEAGAQPLTFNSQKMCLMYMLQSRGKAQLPHPERTSLCFTRPHMGDHAFLPSLCNLVGTQPAQVYPSFFLAETRHPPCKWLADGCESRPCMLCCYNNNSAMLCTKHRFA